MARVVRESYPLWVLVTLGLILLGSVAYVVMAFLADHMMTMMQ